MLLAEPQLADAVLDRPQWRNYYPAELVRLLRPDAGQITVVGLAERDLEIDVVREKRQEERGVDDLVVGAHGLHVLEPPIQIGQLAGGHVWSGRDTRRGGGRGEQKAALAGGLGKD